MDALIVDDDDDLREMVVLVLEEAGFDAVGLADPRLLVRTAERLHPSLVLLDLSMPGLDLEAVVAGLRHVPSLPAIVALSGRCDAESVVLNWALDGLLPKPFSSGTLVETASRHCVRRVRVESAPDDRPPAL